MLNTLSLAVYHILLISVLTFLSVPVSLSDTRLDITTSSDSNDDKILAIGFPAFVSSLSWNDINNFAYQLQEIDLDAIGDTKFDLIIIDYSSDGSESGRFGTEEVDALKNSAGGSKRVLGYMSIGEAENYRFYWEESWDADNDGQPDTGAPSWLDSSNPDWPGNYEVKYWEPEWQSIIFGSSTSYLDKIIDAGFDGVYLDIIDAYEYWGPDGESGEERETAEDEMVDFVMKISEYAKGKNPDFGIFPQNGAALGAHEEYLNAVTGIGQEDIYYGYNGDGQKTPKNITEELEGYLDVFKNAGKLVLTIDYPFSCSEDEPCFNKRTRKKIKSAYRKSRKKGYIPYCTVRNLNYLTINPGHQP
jgi:cysteinyl-tRNA synthetase